MKRLFRNLSFITIVASLFMFITSGCSNSNDYEIFAAIHGCVVDDTTGQPLENATITLSPSGLSKTTDVFGYYEFKNLDATLYTLTVQCRGYMPNRKQVTTVSGENFEVDIHLLPIPEN